MLKGALCSIGEEIFSEEKDYIDGFCLFMPKQTKSTSKPYTVLICLYLVDTASFSPRSENSLFIQLWKKTCISIITSFVL